MNEETKRALRCGAQLRQVVTDIVEKMEFVDLRDQTLDIALQKTQLRKALVGIKGLLVANGLYERVYPLDPEDDEKLRDACRRIFGIWISNDVLDRKDEP
jgi:hypothetical protein